MKERITIDHLIGQTCILNNSAELGLRKSKKRDGTLELFVERESQNYFKVKEVREMLADGGFIVSLYSRRDKLVDNSAVLISKKLYLQKNPKRHPH